jgi:hypothetical protein
MSKEAITSGPFGSILMREGDGSAQVPIPPMMFGIEDQRRGKFWMFSAEIRYGGPSTTVVFVIVNGQIQGELCTDEVSLSELLSLVIAPYGAVEPFSIAQPQSEQSEFMGAFDQLLGMRCPSEEGEVAAGK